MKPIETTYRGYKFRSRLEARWAVFFDTLGIQWEYEPEGYQLDNGIYYLPDFWLSDFDCFAEVKPARFTQKEFDKCRKLSSSCLLLDTSVPLGKHGYYVTRAFDEVDTYSHYCSEDNYGRVILQESKRKGRLWFLLGENLNDYWIDEAPEVAAKSARFEYGAQP